MFDWGCRVPIAFYAAYHSALFLPLAEAFYQTVTHQEIINENRTGLLMGQNSSFIKGRHFQRWSDWTFKLFEWSFWNFRLLSLNIIKVANQFGRIILSDENAFLLNYIKGQLYSSPTILNKKGFFPNPRRHSHGQEWSDKAWGVIVHRDKSKGNLFSIKEGRPHDLLPDDQDRHALGPMFAFMGFFKIIMDIYLKFSLLFA